MKPIRFLLVSGFLFFGLTFNSKAQQQMNSLTNKQQSIVTIAAFTAKGHQDKLTQALNEGLNAGLSINEVKEVLVQLYAYAGFPRSLNAITTFESVVNDRRSKGIKDSEGKEPDDEKFKNGRFEFGKNVQTQLTGTSAIGAPQKFVPVIDTFLKEHLFADIFSRNNLDFQTREIATISTLASLGGTEAQLISHLKVGKNVGLTEDQLNGIASVLSSKVGQDEGELTTKNIGPLFHPTDNINDGTSVPEKANLQKNNRPFSQGNKITNDNFSGTAWLSMLMDADTTYDTQIGNVTFEPGARTRWHYHSGGQILLVTRGTGLYQEQGHPVKVMKEGDVIKCPPNIVHWHGANANSSLTHIAVSPNTDKGSVVWLEKVTDQEYNNH